MDLKLLPCPFCGQVAHFDQVPQDNSDNAGGHFVVCSNALCAASTNVRFSMMDDARQGLAEQWNRRALPELNVDLIEILGRPNFLCIRIAQLLRLGGQAIENKAEHEQAAVLYYLLGFYLQHGADWWQQARDDLRKRADACDAGASK